MNILAMCDRRYESVTRRIWGKHATGGALLTSPPLTSPVERDWFAGWDVIYIDLHGEPGDPWLYGEPGTRALHLQDVRHMQLGGAVVFATTCYLPRTGFVNAFLEAGAVGVVGGDGENYGAKPESKTPHGAQLLGERWIGYYRYAQDAERALELAKNHLRKHCRSWSEWALHYKAAKDAMQFQVWRNHAV